MSKRYITLPNGRRCGLAVYLDAWRQLRAMDPNIEVTGFDHFSQAARHILREIQYGIHDRINRHIPGFGQGRKWSYEWQVETLRAARALNTPRLAIHWLPSWLKPRFSHRISTFND